MTFEVTKQDVKEGIPCSSLDCPVALALTRKFPGSYVCVTGYHINVGLMVYKVSKTLTAQIYSFDNTKKFKTGKYLVRKA